MAEDLHDNIGTQLATGRKYLLQSDPEMAPVIRKAGPITLRLSPSPFDCLVVQILNQLVSAKAAQTVEQRLRQVAGPILLPENLLTFSDQDFRALGIGLQKGRYIRGIAQAFLDRPDTFANLRAMDDTEVIAALTELRGIGKWTAQMFLIFGLGRMDVFAPDDLVLYQATDAFFLNARGASKQEVARRASTWSPWRTVASLYLWKAWHQPE